MNSDNTFEKIRGLISQNYNEKAIKYLIEYLENSPNREMYIDDLILIHNQFEDFSRRQKLGLEIKNSEKNEITYRLIKLLRVIQDSEVNDNSEVESIFKNIRSEYRKSSANMLLVRGGTIVITTSLVAFLSIMMGVNLIIIIFMIILSLLLSTLISDYF